MLKNLVKKIFGSQEVVSTGAETSNVLSLYTLQHAEHFKCFLETDLKAMNVNVKHEDAFEYGDPFYTAAHYAFDRAYHVFF